jgi:putative ABC transport system permease protein
MLKHNLLTALRHFAKAKAITAINVLCLTFGLTCSLLAYGIVESIDTPDIYHEKASRTYVVTQRSKLTDAVALTLPFAGRAYAPALEADYPQLEHVVRASKGAEIAVSSGDVKGFAMAAYVDPEFLDVFDFDFIGGDRRRALQSPASAVINETLARELFGTTDVMGTPLLLNNGETVHITGVMKSPRQPSHMSSNGQSVALQQFQLLVSIDAWRVLRSDAQPTEAEQRSAYLTMNTFVFLLFRADSPFTPEQLRADLPAFVERHHPPILGSTTLGIVPASDIGSVAMDVASRREETGLTISGLTLGLGVIVLIVACLNYANLASAVASTQLKETAMRRVVGASYRQIVFQAFMEALLLTTLSACLALALIPLLAALLQVRMGVHLYELFSHSIEFWAALAATIVTVAAVASLYPALVAARVRPAQSLHSGRTPLFKARALRALVILQFAAASFLFVTSRMVDAHNDGLLVGFAAEGDDPMVVITNDLKDIGVDRRLLQDRLAAKPGIKGVSAIEVPPGTLFGPTTIVSANADPGSKRTMVVAPAVDYDFFAAVHIPVLTGRVFDRNIATDVSTGGEIGNVVIDRRFVEERGWTPQTAIGKAIFLPTGKDGVGRASTVIGVVEDHTLYPAKLGSAATLYVLDPQRVTALLVRIPASNVSLSLQSIDEVWNDFAPRVALKRKFLDEAFEMSYRQMSSMSYIVGFLASFAVVIAAMGLVGIATHAIGQRTHEIGVRKSLGASVQQIVVMLLRDFSKPILIGNLLGWPLAYGYARIFESVYVQRPSITYEPFLESLVLGLVVAWITVFHKAWCAARLSPASVLRHE